MQSGLTRGKPDVEVHSLALGCHNHARYRLLRSRRLLCRTRLCCAGSCLRRLNPGLRRPASGLRNSVSERLRSCTCYASSNIRCNRVGECRSVIHLHGRTKWDTSHLGSRAGSNATATDVHRGPERDTSHLGSRAGSNTAPAERGPGAANSALCWQGPTLSDSIDGSASRVALGRQYKTNLEPCAYEGSSIVFTFIGALRHVHDTLSDLS